MSSFSYKARSRTGEIKTGTMDIASEREARKKIEQEGMTLISLKEGEEKKGLSFSAFNNLFPVPAIEVITFVHLLSVMVKAGLSLSKSLSALSKQTKNAKFSKVIEDVSISISKGNSFADALSKHPEVFDELFINMVKVGEISGTLEAILFLLAEQMKKDYELRGKVKGAMMYPAVILTVMCAVGVVAMVYIIPKMADMFKTLNVELPVTTRIMVGASYFIKDNGIFLLIGLVIFGYLFSIFAKGKGAPIVDKVILKLPVVGEIAKKINIARFARTTSSLVRGGVSISTALKTVSRTLSNYHYKGSINSAAEKIEKGMSLKEILGNFGDLYPPLVLQMIEVGEETGSLDDILMDLAEFYESEVNETTKNLSTIIEPILMVVMGVGVGFFAISIIQPMYSIGDAIK